MTLSGCSSIHFNYAGQCCCGRMDQLLLDEWRKQEEEFNLLSFPTVKMLAQTGILFSKAIVSVKPKVPWTWHF